MLKTEEHPSVKLAFTMVFRTKMDRNNIITGFYEVKINSNLTCFKLQCLTTVFIRDGANQITRKILQATPFLLEFEKTQKFTLPNCHSQKFFLLV